LQVIHFTNGGIHHKKGYFYAVHTGCLATMDLLTIITVLIILSAAFSYVNERFIKLPGTIGVVTLSVILSILLLIAGRTNSGIARIFSSLAHSIDFSEVLLKVLLGVLLI
jgi:CPA1 family monovalent cation:H+ antiporter